MQAIILGSAAGGGSPQWNCGCPVCVEVRSGACPPRSQSSLAVSADGRRWLLVNASPDLRQQILETEELWPRAGSRRDSPIAAVLVTNADVDHVAGLLTLRERQPFALYATARVQEVLAANPVFQVLAPEAVSRRDLVVEEPLQPLAPTQDGEKTENGLEVTAFRVPGKVALYLEGQQEELALAAETDDTVGLEITAGGRRLLYVPGCAAVTPSLRQRLEGADCLLFDGTVWHDDEMARAGVGAKTGRRMGHLPIAGEEGSLAALAGLSLGRRIFVHINNTNPILLPGSEQRRALEAAGWEVAYDGQRLAP